MLCSCGGETCTAANPAGPSTLLALVRDVGPFPFEEVDEHVASGHVAAGAIGLRECRPIRGELAGDWRAGRGTVAARGEQQERGGGFAVETTASRSGPDAQAANPRGRRRIGCRTT